MQHSEALDKIAPALLAFQRDLKAVADDSVNPAFKSKYASFESVLAEAIHAASPHGLFITQGTANEDDLGLQVETTFLHESGQWVSNLSPRIPTDKRTPHTAVAAMTYAKRTGLSATGGMRTGEPDDDGNTATFGLAVADAPQRQNVPAPASKPAAATPIQAVVPKVAASATLGVLPDGCITCGGPIWDNRDPASKKNPKAPDWKCKDKECKDTRGFVTAGWCEKGPAVKQTGGGPGLETIPTALQDDDEPLPF